MPAADAHVMELRIRQIREEAQDILSFELVAQDGQALPRFTAGSHIDLHLGDRMVRSYSLVNDPAEDFRYVIAVARDAASRGGSDWMHAVPRVGQSMPVSLPVNDFPLHDGPGHAILIAGGIGITPFLSMARQLARLSRPWKLYYSARSRERAAFVSEMRELAQPGLQPIISFDDEAAPMKIDQVVGEAPTGAHFYCCGPSGMLEAYLAACDGQPKANVHYERFSASQAAALEGGFELVLQRSGQRMEVAAGRSILETLLARNIDVQYACSEGVCGTCKTVVLQGEPDHRDDYLTAEEKAANRTMMICCSGARSKTLVLDL